MGNPYRDHQGNQPSTVASREVRTLVDTESSHLSRVALTAPQLARVLGVGNRLARRLMRSGELAVFEISGRVYVARHEVDRWLNPSDTRTPRSRA